MSLYQSSTISNSLSFLNNIWWSICYNSII
jgi:hypothetical protein